MLLEAVFAVSDLGRLREIASVLASHGFGDLIQRTGIRRALARAGHALHLRKSSDVDEASTPVRARRALEELGPTFAKLGQLLANRPDLLPPHWVEELSKLHAHVATLPFDDIRPALEEDLGMPPEEAFASFDPEPIAAGTIAQVYAATLHDGREVVAKVRRPDIADKVKSDLRLLYRIARIVEEEESYLRQFRPEKVVREFSRVMRGELDLRIEARNLEVMARHLGDRPDVALPQVVESFTREALLVMTRLDGCSAADWLAGDRDNEFNPRRVAQAGADIVLQMIFEDGFYHGDPHPGNLLFLPDGRIGLLDFGQVGRLSEIRRRELVQLLGAVAARDEEMAVDTLLAWSDEGDHDLNMMSADVRGLIDRYEGMPMGQLNVSALLLDVTELTRENNLALPSDVALLIKVFLTLEGLCRALHPDFKLSRHVEPAARELVKRIASPRAVIRRNLGDLRSILMHLPGDLRSLLTRARRGDLRLELDLRRLDKFGQQITRGTNRITVGMITAALIIGTSIAMTTDRGPAIFGWPILGLFGFLCSAAIGIGLLWSILRTRR